MTSALPSADIYYECNLTTDIKPLTTNDYAPMTDDKPIYDITPPISSDIKVWPGDTPSTREVLRDVQRGDASTTSVLHATVHLGAHADAPNHCDADAPSIGECDLDAYLGPCQVIHVHADRGARLLPDSLKTPVVAQRLLIATGAYPNPLEFNRDFAALSPELIESLRHRGVKLIGIDTPSVDPFEAEDLPAHRAALGHGIAILEGLVLDGVPEGMYELIALPLKLIGFEASPVRAILKRTSPQNSLR